MPRMAGIDWPVANPVRWLLASAGSLILLVGIVAWIASPASTEPGLSRERFEQATGLRLVRVAVTAGGGLIDIRYQALDPDKAGVVHDPLTPPTLIAERSGLTIDRPWMDHAHRRELRTAVTYYTLLVNPGHAIKPGDAVTFQLGDARLSGITVE